MENYRELKMKQDKGRQEGGWSESKFLLFIFKHSSVHVQMYKQ